MLMPFNIHQWIKEHRQELRPPVGNKCFYPNSSIIVMLIAGPNTRTDFHTNEAEEIFYQLEGDITVKIKEANSFRDIPIKQGELFLLPPNIPHSPIRPPGSLGIVVERYPLGQEKAGFDWYCDHCQASLYSESLVITDIEKDLPQIFSRYWGNPAHTTCKQCGHKHEKPWSKK